MKRFDDIIQGKRHEFGEDSLQKWYNPHDTIEVTRETVLQIISRKRHI